MGHTHEPRPASAAAPVIVGHPLAQCVPREAQVTLGVIVEPVPPALFAPFTYQWQRNRMPNREEYENLAGKTGSQLTLERVSADDVGYYRVIVTGAGTSVISEAAPLVVWEHSGSFLVSGPVVVAAGNSGTGCPGNYHGYAVYTKASPAWGWQPNGPQPLATNPDNYPIEATASTLQTYCDPNGAVGVPSNPSVRYRFAVYFNRLPVPPTPYRIRLRDFAP